jgi:hypothetical protein
MSLRKKLGGVRIALKNPIKPSNKLILRGIGNSFTNVAYL